jgi:hypothetical protein
MAAPTDEAFSGLSYQDVLPLRFRALPAVPEGATLAAINAGNLQVLIAELSLDDHHPAFDKLPEELAPLAQDLHRLESKLNLLIQLVARFAGADGKAPPAVAWRLHAHGLEWISAEGGGKPGSFGQVELYLSRNLPQPLTLPGRVCPPLRDPQGEWQRLAFEGLSEKVTEQLERHVFRHHRRSVAGQRAHPKP